MSCMACIQERERVTRLCQERNRVTSCKDCKLEPICGLLHGTD
jgi:hypothetical protein